MQRAYKSRDHEFPALNFTGKFYKVKKPSGQYPFFNSFHPDNF